MNVRFPPIADGTDMLFATQRLGLIMRPTSKTMLILTVVAVGSALIALLAQAFYGVKLMIGFLALAAACGVALLDAPNRDQQTLVYIIGLVAMMVTGGLALWALER